jgi:hypothetical protein
VPKEHGGTLWERLKGESVLPADDLGLIALEEAGAV